MKKLYIILLLCAFYLPAKAATLQEDYEQMRPLMEMLSVESGASVNLLTPYVEQGNSVAQYLLGAIYEEGKSVDINKPKAFELFSKAASKNPLAALKVADMQLMADGTDYDLQSARTTYESLKNSADAQVALKAQIRLKQIASVEKQANLLANLEEKALNGDTSAQLELAEYSLETGNLIGAYTWFSFAAEDERLSSKQKEIGAFLNNLEGQMNLSDITKAEKEIEQIKNWQTRHKKTVDKP